MSDITIKNDPNNEGRDSLTDRMRSIWLGIIDEVRTILIRQALGYC